MHVKSLEFLPSWKPDRQDNDWNLDQTKEIVLHLTCSDKSEVHCDILQKIFLRYLWIYDWKYSDLINPFPFFRFSTKK